MVARTRAVATIPMRKPTSVARSTSYEPYTVGSAVSAEMTTQKPKPTMAAANSMQKTPRTFATPRMARTFARR